MAQYPLADVDATNMNDLNPQERSVVGGGGQKHTEDTPLITVENASMIYSV